MTTRLTKPIRREIDIDGEPYTLVVSPEGVRLLKKRFRSGRSISWRALLAGEAGRVAREEDPVA